MVLIVESNSISQEIQLLHLIRISRAVFLFAQCLALALYLKGDLLNSYKDKEKNKTQMLFESTPTQHEACILLSTFPKC